VQEILFGHLSKQHPLMANLIFFFLLNHGYSVDSTGNDGRTPLRAAASNVHLEVPQQLLSNGCSVHIARECDLTALLAAADSDHVELLCELRKHGTCMVIAIKKVHNL
jgi:ankyrin repeat protein